MTVNVMAGWVAMFLVILEQDQIGVVETRMITNTS